MMPSREKASCLPVVQLLLPQELLVVHQLLPQQLLVVPQFRFPLLHLRLSHQFLFPNPSSLQASLP
jgi:hypothetical protein